eukprot:gene5577-11228_t
MDRQQQPNTEFEGSDNNHGDHSDSDNSGDDGDFDLFVGNLGTFCVESHLKEKFSTYDLKDAKVMRSKCSQNSLGYSFLTIGSLEAAKACINEWNGKEWNGRPLNISWAQKNKTLMIRNLEPSMTVDRLNSHFESFGTIKDLTSIEDDTNTESKIGTLHYQSRRAAEIAKQVMQNKTIEGRALVVEWHPNGRQSHTSPMSSGDVVTSIHIRFEHTKAFDVSSRLNEHSKCLINESSIRSAMCAFGTVIDVSIKSSRTKKTGQQHGFGFVHFENSESGKHAALQAVDKLKEWTPIGEVLYRAEASNNLRKQLGLPTGK